MAINQIEESKQWARERATRQEGREREARRQQKQHERVFAFATIDAVAEFKEAREQTRIRWQARLERRMRRAER